MVQRTQAAADDKAPPVTAVEHSRNGKLSRKGGVSCTWVSQATCRCCPYYRNGCYAEQGKAGMVTRRLNSSPERDSRAIARAEARAIGKLSGKRLLRLHVVGDCATPTAARIVGKAAERYTSRCTAPRTGAAVWTYTHNWRAIPRSDWGTGVSVLASCETPAGARDAMAQGYAAALVVPHFESKSAYKLDGVTLLPCPAQTKGRKCDECRLCLDDGRLLKAGLVVGFAAHGPGARAVRTALTVVS